MHKTINWTNTQIPLKVLLIGQKHFNLWVITHITINLWVITKKPSNYEYLQKYPWNYEYFQENYLN